MEKVSIILTTFNCADQLPETLQSVASQVYPEIEVVIKDGGSTDGTLHVIKQFEETSSMPVRWKSEKDGGIYDAMNQGFYMASGSILLFFNDVFSDRNVVAKMVSLINSVPDCAGAHADLVYKKDGKTVRTWKMGEGTIQKGWMPGHPTLFLKRSVYEKYGLYDPTYRCSADYELMIRILKSGEIRLAYLPETIVEMYYGGTSTNGLSGYWISWKEGYRALRKNGIRNTLGVNVRRMVRVMKQFRRMP